MKGIKCTTENAEKNTLSRKNVERVCDDFHEPPPAEPFLPKCDQTSLFREGREKENCRETLFKPECFVKPEIPNYCASDDYRIGAI